MKVNLDWEKINAVSKMQRYLNELDDINFNKLKFFNVTGYSYSHSVRMFKELIGVTPTEYLRSLQLTRAAKKLLTTNESGLEIAYQSNYSSQEGFIKSFRKEFGVTPQKYRVTKQPVKYTNPYDIKDFYRLVEYSKSEVKLTTPRVVLSQIAHKPKRKIILKRSKNANDFFSYFKEVGYDVIGILQSVHGAIGEYAFTDSLPDSLVTEGTTKFACLIEVPFDYKGVIPSGFDVAVLPACDMMYFFGEPYHENYLFALEEIKKISDSFAPAVFGYQFDSDVAPSLNFLTGSTTGWKIARPIKKV